MSLVGAAMVLSTLSLATGVAHKGAFLAPWVLPGGSGGCWRCRPDAGMSDVGVVRRHKAPCRQQCGGAVRIRSRWGAVFCVLPIPRPPSLFCHCYHSFHALHFVRSITLTFASRTRMCGAAQHIERNIRSY